MSPFAGSIQPLFRHISPASRSALIVADMPFTSVPSSLSSKPFSAYIPGMNEEIILTGGGRTEVSRQRSIVYRQSGPWSPTIISLLRHLAQVGFAACPRVVGTGFDERGRETLSFIEGEFVHPGPWSDEAMPRLGNMLRQLHEATSSFKVPDNGLARVVWPRTRNRSACHWSLRHRLLEHCLSLQLTNRPHRLGGRRTGRNRHRTGASLLVERPAFR